MSHHKDDSTQVGSQLQKYKTIESTKIIRLNPIMVDTYLIDYSPSSKYDYISTYLLYIKTYVKPSL